MALIISDEILAKSQLSEQEFLIEIACYLYDKKRLSMGKARELAKLHLIDFQKELAKRDIDIHYSREDLDKDLKNLGISLS
jgi:predicted HTH domain antitoxin